MRTALEVIGIFFSLPSLAHTLENPGKVRLDRETSFAVQPIYDPGFTYIGDVAEPGTSRLPGS